MLMNLSKAFCKFASKQAIKKEYNGTRNWWALPKEVQKKIMRVKLNSSDFRYFRTSEGSL